MTCDAPIQAYKSGVVNPVTGKRPMQFKAAGSFSGVRQMLPCGKCLGCRLDWSFGWGVRIVHETKMHKASSFVTLTYDNDHLPEFGTLVPEHLQAFHKRLHNRMRYARGYGIRWYGCGEYGDLNKRPHYHSILFGMDFPDKKYYSVNKRGEKLYTSKMLDEVWGMGACKIGEVTFDSAQYVANYHLKRVDGDMREAGHYLVYDADGVIHERVPEFGHMSRNPGIGASYYEKYGAEIRTHDTIIMKGREVPSLRYYDQKFEKLDPVGYALTLEKRRDKRLVQPFSEKSPDRRRVKERLREKLVQQKERKL